MSNLPYRFEIEQESGGWAVVRYPADGRSGTRRVLDISSSSAEARAWLHGYLTGRHAVEDEAKPS